MAIKDAIDEIGISFEDLCESSGIPASTLSDILSGKAVLSHCQARTIQKLSKGLDMSMEEVLDLENTVPSVNHYDIDLDIDDDDEEEETESKSEGAFHRLACPVTFQFFRSNMLETLHILSSVPDGELMYIAASIESNTIENLFNSGCYDAALYTLGLTDYLCNKNGIPILAQYDRYRGHMMEKTIYCPEAAEDPVLDSVYFQNMIPQFLKYNMIETPETLKQY